MSRRYLPLLGAAVLVLLAFVLALLARDVRAWGESLPEGDRAFQAGPGPDRLWAPDSVALGGVARSLLGVDDDLRVRHAAQLFRRARPRGGQARTPQQLSVGTAAQVAFGEIQAGDYTPEVRSMAANELGVLALVDALSDPTQVVPLTKRAVQKFVEARRLDPDNEAARANLELVLTLLSQDDPRVKPVDTDASGGSAPGAGSGSGGSGL